MIQKHRIRTEIGKDQKVTVELKQDYDLLEILSLKFTQKDIYTANGVVHLIDTVITTVD